MLNSKFPNHCTWEKPGYITRMSREEFENNYKREQDRGNVYVSEDIKHGQYSKASTWFNEVDDHWMFEIYLEKANLNLKNTTEHVSTYYPLQKRLLINFTKKACGRGG